MKKPKAPPSTVLSLAALAKAWGCDMDHLELMAAGGELLVSYLPGLDGRAIPCVSQEERERCEGAKSSRPARFNPTERESLLLLSGALAVLWCGGKSEFEDHPYRLGRDIAEGAAGLGVPFPRGDDTTAAILREAITTLRAFGYRQS